MSENLPAIRECDNSPIQQLEDFPPYDQRFEIQLSKMDLAVILLAGFAGTLTSILLKDFCAEIHDHFGRKTTDKGGHSGESTDIVPGNSQPGGFGHRNKFGHDFLNPFEIYWDTYKKLAEQTGTSLPLPLKAYLLWLRHLFQDTFSTDGLPVPGNTIFRLFSDFSNPQTRQFLAIFTTIKQRDIAGASVTNLILRTYLTTFSNNTNQLSQAYLYFGANFVTFLCGLLAPQEYKSANLNTIPKMIFYTRKIWRIQNEAAEFLNKRQQILIQNDEIIANNDKKLQECIEQNYQTFLAIDLEDSVEKMNIINNFKNLMTLQEVPA